MMTKNFFAIATLLLLALAGLVSSAPQSLPPLTFPTVNFDPTAITEGTNALSPTCQKALTGILTNADVNKCLPVPALEALLTDPTILKQIAADPLHKLRLLSKTFDAVCALPKCADALVGVVIQNVTVGCQTEITNKDPTVQALLAGAIAYSPARDSICFQNPKKDYCLFETVDNIASLPASPVVIFKDNKLADSIAVGSPDLICTPCSKAIINTIFNYYNGDHSLFKALLATIKFNFGLLNLAVDIKCGLPFNDGKVGDPTIPPQCPK